MFRHDVLPPREVVEDLLERAEYDDERERIERSAAQPQPVEIAFATRDNRILPSPNCVLFAYLPTSIETHLHFVIQARYQTIPSRNDINNDVLWNHWLLEETATLLPNALERLKAGGMLTVNLLEALPSQDDHIPTFFVPIREASQRAFRERELIPTSDGRYLSANRVFYPHTRSVRSLFSTSDLAEITKTEGAAWLHPEVQASARALEILCEMRRWRS